MFFGDRAIENLAESYATLGTRHDQLVEAYISHAFTSEKAARFAREGFNRRLAVMKHAIIEVFDLLPPNEDDIPDVETRTKALVNLHAFVMNVFGALDNLAWIWVLEKKISCRDGSTLPQRYVGLGPKDIALRSSLSDAFRMHLRGLKKWFHYLEDFRHALAHRVPFYIPPHTILEKDAARYAELERLKGVAGSLARYNELCAQQRQLERFVPVIRQTFGKSKPIVFHLQIMRDFATIEELGRMMLKELDRKLDKKERRVAPGRLARFFGRFAKALSG